MTPSASPRAAAAATGLPPSRPSLATRIVGVIRRPRTTLTALAHDPRWLDVLTVTTLAACLSGAALMQTQVGRQALIDQWERTAAAVGHEVDDAGYARLESLSRYGGWYAAGTALLAVPLLTVAAAAAIHVAGRRTRPGVRFATALAVASHAGVILGLRQTLAAPLAYLRESTTNAFSLGAGFQALDAASPAARALGFIDLFVCWWSLLLALGVAAVYGRPMRNVALGVVGLYAVAAALLTVVLAFVKGA